jgi:hypothetical protein
VLYHYAANQFVAVHSWHSYIREHNIETLRRAYRHRVGCAGGGTDFVAGACERSRQQRADISFVIDDQDTARF